MTETGRRWSQNDEAMRQEAAACPSRFSGVARPAETVPWLEREGGGTVGLLWIRPDFDRVQGEDARSRLLRELVLQIAWDGGKQPSVEAPFRQSSMFW